jgi:hypothetical protein
VEPFIRANLSSLDFHWTPRPVMSPDGLARPYRDGPRLDDELVEVDAAEDFDL